MLYAMQKWSKAENKREKQRIKEENQHRNIDLRA